MAQSDWKTKYLDIRSKLIEATNVAYRLGYEEGMKKGQQAAQDQQMQMQAETEAQAAAMGGIPPEEGGMPPGAEGEMPPEEVPASIPGMEGEEEPMDASTGGGSELDQHIDELESLVAKGEKPSVLTVRKAVAALVGIRKSEKAKRSKYVKTESSQKKVVDNILKKWEKETNSLSKDIEDIVESDKG